MNAITWVRCDEKMPPEGEEVLITWEYWNRPHSASWYDAGEGKEPHWWIDTDSLLHDATHCCDSTNEHQALFHLHPDGIPTHWMPIPKINE